MNWILIKMSFVNENTANFSLKHIYLTSKMCMSLSCSLVKRHRLHNFQSTNLVFNIIQNISSKSLKCMQIDPEKYQRPFHNATKSFVRRLNALQGII